MIDRKPRWNRMTGWTGWVGVVGFGDPTYAVSSGTVNLRGRKRREIASPVFDGSQRRAFARSIHRSKSIVPAEMKMLSA
jgi:hypothetical protein